MAGNPEAIADGSKIYAQNCAACHGPNGMGNGDIGKALSPSPALLAYMIRRPIAVDEYLLWTVSEGGKQFGSEMPAFKDKLSREEIGRSSVTCVQGLPNTVLRPFTNSFPSCCVASILTPLCNIYSHRI